MMRSPDLKRKPYTVYAVRGSKLRRAARVVFATLLVVVLMVVAVFGGLYLWLDSQVNVANQVRTPADSAAISVIREPADSSAVDPVIERPDAQDILVLGSDVRAGLGEEYGRSDTLMLVHVAPDEDFISVLSIPRDLRVKVPGHGWQKINGAYALGGPALSIRTVQELLHLDLDHYVNLDFQAFRDITTALGGIYVDVDRRYHNANDRYEKIDIQPGYQRLEGENALDFVRFRHDNYGDFHRIERQQRFMTAARDQISKWDAAFKIPELVGVIAKNTSTDITTTQAIRLALWAARLDGSRIKQVRLISDIDMVDGISYVVASEQAIRDAARALVEPPAGPDPAAGTGSTGGSGDATGTTATPVWADLTGVTVNVLNGNGRPGEAGATGSWLESMGAVVGRVGDAASNSTRSEVAYPPESADAAGLVAKALGMTNLREGTPGSAIAVTLGSDFLLPEEYRPRPSFAEVPDSVEWKSLGAKAAFPLMAPGSVPYPLKFKESRLYEIDSGDGSYPALKVVYKYGGEDQYMGVMETTFVDAPAAADGEESTVYGIDYTVVGTDGRVDHVWWKNDGVLYWVSNSLGYAFDKEDMLGFATSMIPVP